jgi:hypothetical protein
METKELIQALRSDAEWAHANEWETPITLGDHLDAAADAIEALLSVTAERDALKERTHAERDGQLYTVHDVAVILASAIGDDCACNINSNDEWLPQLCELQEACPEPVGVACWEQYLKHRAEAEKALGKGELS